MGNNPVNGLDPSGEQVKIKDVEKGEETLTDLFKGHALYARLKPPESEDKIIREIIHTLVNNDVWLFDSEDEFAYNIALRIYTLRSAYELGKQNHEFSSGDPLTDFPNSLSWEPVTVAKIKGIALKANTSPYTGVSEFFTGKKKAILDCGAFAQLVRLRAFMLLLPSDKLKSIMPEDLSIFGKNITSRKVTVPVEFLARGRREKREPVPGDLVVFENTSVPKENPFHFENTIYFGKTINDDGKDYYYGFPMGLKDEEEMKKAIRIGSHKEDAEVTRLDPVFSKIYISEDFKKP